MRGVGLAVLAGGVTFLLEMVIMAVCSPVNEFVERWTAGTMLVPQESCRTLHDAITGAQLQQS